MPYRPLNRYISCVPCNCSAWCEAGSRGARSPSCAYCTPSTILQNTGMHEALTACIFSPSLFPRFPLWPPLTCASATIDKQVLIVCAVQLQRVVRGGLARRQVAFLRLLHTFACKLQAVYRGRSSRRNYVRCELLIENLSRFLRTCRNLNVAGIALEWTGQMALLSDPMRYRICLVLNASLSVANSHFGGHELLCKSAVADQQSCYTQCRAGCTPDHLLSVKHYL